MTIRKTTPTIIVPARDVKDGAWLVTNSGDVREMTPTIRARMGSLPVRTFAT